MCNIDKMFYPTSDGIHLCGILTTSSNIKGWTIMAHGITQNKDEWNDLYVDIAQKLCQKGFASLRFDFRAHGESEGRQEDITIKGELLDMKASAKILMKQNKKVSIIAMSFGAGPAILYTAQNRDKVKSLILLCPVLDYTSTFLKPLVPWAKESFNEKGFRHLDKKGYLLLDGNFKIGAKMIEEFRIIKPYEILKEIKCPVLTIHGNEDSMVPYSVSKRYGTPNKKSKFITFKGAEHGFIDPDDETGNSKESKIFKEHLMNVMVEWLRKNG